MYTLGLIFFSSLTIIGIITVRDAIRYDTGELFTGIAIVATLTPFVFVIAKALIRGNRLNDEDDALFLFKKRW